MEFIFVCVCVCVLCVCSLCVFTVCACVCVQERQLDQNLFGLRVKRLVGQRPEISKAEPTEPLRDLVGTSAYQSKPV